MLEILNELAEDESRYRFESYTGYDISTYKNNTELATAFLLYRERIGFDYGLMAPEYPSDRKCEIDFALHRKRIFKELPSHINVLNWPGDKPVKYIENKRNVHGKFTRHPKEVMDKLMTIEKRYWKSGTRHALMQREFLLREGYETFVLGDDGNEWYYYNGLLLNR